MRRRRPTKARTTARVIDLLEEEDLGAEIADSEGFGNAAVLAVGGPIIIGL